MFSAIQKCRRCQTWKRTDIAMSGIRDKLDVESVVFRETFGPFGTAFPDFVNSSSNSMGQNA